MESVSSAGSISSSELIKHLSADSQSSAQSAGPQRSAVTPTQSKRIDGSSVAIYASFMTAVTGAVSLQLIRRHGAIPLGSRTLLTFHAGDDKSNITTWHANSASAACLTTLQLQLTLAGRLTVSVQTFPQPGITRFHARDDYAGDVYDAITGADVWLSPTGAIARVVTTNPGPMSLSSSNPSNSTTATERAKWKSVVSDWFSRFQLSAVSDEEDWVEVEVWEPFYAKLAGETWRQGAGSSPSMPLKRIFWPARYCFRRTRAFSVRLNTFPGECEDPLDFAKRWREEKGYGTEGTTPELMPDVKEEPAREPQPPSPSSPPDLPEEFESLARLAQYPEIQPASLVYPTPPDGTGFSSLNPTDAFGDADITMPNIQKDGSYGHSLNPNLHFESGPSPGLAVGSGLYDTNDDDDLFGEMDDREFGTKGITDADFSFFDDPGFSEMEGITPAENIQETPKVPEPGHPNMPSQDDHTIPEAQPTLEIPAEGEYASQGLGPAAPAEPPSEDMPNRPTTSAEEHSHSMSPPLSPIEVKRILFPASDQRNVPNTSGQKLYGAVAFDRHMSDWEQKYGSTGRFRFSSSKPSASDAIDPCEEIPTVGLPFHRSKSNTRSTFSKPLDDHATPSSGSNWRKRSVSLSSSDMSDDMDEGASENEAHDTTASTLKRKRALSANSTGSTSESQSMPLDRRHPAANVEESIFIGNFLSIFSDWSLAGYFSASQDQAWPELPPKQEQVQVAQLLVNQVSQSSLNHGLDVGKSVPDIEMHHTLCTVLKSPSLCGEAEKLDLNGFASLEDDQTLPVSSEGRVAEQAAERKETGKGAIARLPPPHVRVHRGTDYFEALPPAISFWETFGLGPASGPKDITAYCIHPPVTKGAADAFLDRLGWLYSSCNLGEHRRGRDYQYIRNGLASWGNGLAGGYPYSVPMQALRTSCEDLCMYVA